MTTALYRFYDTAGALLYVGVTSHPERRIDQHAAAKPWFTEIATASFEHYQRRAQALEAERHAIANEAPRYNRAGRKPRLLVSDRPADSSPQARPGWHFLPGTGWIPELPRRPT